MARALTWHLGGAPIHAERIGNKFRVTRDGDVVALVKDERSALRAAITLRNREIVEELRRDLLRAAERMRHGI